MNNSSRAMPTDDVEAYFADRWPEQMQPDTHFPAA